MNFAEQSLDFNGSNHELQLRLQWAKNAAEQRRFWTPERRCLSWMQGHTPDESDMQWWHSQPVWNRTTWLALHAAEQSRIDRLRLPMRPFEHVWENHLAGIDERIRNDESRIAHYMLTIRQDFLAGRPCSISIDGADPAIRSHLARLMRLALDRVTIPPSCLHPSPSPSPSKSPATPPA